MAQSQGVLASETESVRDKFTLFSKCHQPYNGNVVSDAEIEQLGEHSKSELHFFDKLQYLVAKDIDEFLAYYRKEFPHATILPKMHLMEDHIIPFMKRFHVGAGLLGEQGAESLHSHLKKLEATYSSIPDGVDRLKYIFHEYSLEVSPQLQQLKPPVQQRKKRRIEE